MKRFPLRGIKDGFRVIHALFGMTNPQQDDQSSNTNHYWGGLEKRNEAVLGGREKTSQAYRIFNYAEIKNQNPSTCFSSHLIGTTSMTYRLKTAGMPGCCHQSAHSPWHPAHNEKKMWTDCILLGVEPFRPRIGTFLLLLLLLLPDESQREEYLWGKEARSQHWE